MSQEQQKQDDEARMMRELALLQQVDRAGLKSVALELAASLGLTSKFNQEMKCVSGK